MKTRPSPEKKKRDGTLKPQTPIIWGGLEWEEETKGDQVNLR